MDSTASTRHLVLASTSPFRRELLGRLGLAFDTVAPDTDETPWPGEQPQHLVTRLAEAKARAVVGRFPSSVIIGSDQVACIDGAVLGKPGTRDAAIAQLRRASGRAVEFFTGLCVLDAASGEVWTVVEPFRVHFRQLTDEQIAHYLERETPFNCAGSFKSEGLGIALFRRLEGDDPNALVGLPLIRLTEMLYQAGVPVL
jgi:septum formation protein